MHLSLSHGEDDDNVEGNEDEEPTDKDDEDENVSRSSSPVT